MFAKFASCALYEVCLTVPLTSRPEPIEDLSLPPFPDKKLGFRYRSWLQQKKIISKLNKKCKWDFSIQKKIQYKFF
jgi:hypothetical protein